MKRGLLFLALNIIMGLILNSWIPAEAVPPAPNFNNAEVINHGNNDYKIHVTWTSGGGSPSEYRIYIANANTEYPNNPLFGLARTYYPTGGDSAGYSDFVDFTTDGDFSLYITAFKDGEESTPSAFKHLNFTHPPNVTVSFTSSPVENGYVGEIYTYNAIAEASPSGAVTYVLTSSIPDLSVDAATGVVTWNSPTDVGKFHASLTAYLTSDNRIYAVQSWVIKVRTCSGSTTVSGTVTDDITNEPMTSGTVTFYHWTNDSNNYHTYQYYGSASIGSDGTYSKEVDEGKYQLSVNGQDFDTEWYQDKATSQDADEVDIVCGTTNTLNFAVHKLAPHFNISGKVTKSSDDSPVQGAVVNFYGSFTGDVNPTFKQHAMTNHDGKYSIRLSNEYEYRAMAEGKDSTYNSNQDFLPQFSDHVVNPSEATPIILTEDITGIDFSLSYAPDITNSVRGNVVSYPGGSNLPAWVIIYVDEAPYDLRTFDATSTNGHFVFSGLTAGTYIIQSIPTDDTYYSGYYNTTGNGLVVSDWHVATTIDVNETTDENATIRHEQSEGGSGEGIFSGIVGISGRNIKLPDKNNKIQSNNILPGAMVYVISKTTHKVVKCVPSNYLGEFKISGLELKDFDIIVDRIGYHKSETTISLSKDNKTENRAIEMVPNTVGVEEEITSSTRISTYPNPSSDILQVQFITKESSVGMELLNSIGITLYNSTLQTNCGINKTNINVKDFPSGLFFVRIKEKNGNMCIPVVVEH